MAATCFEVFATTGESVTAAKIVSTRNSAAADSNVSPML